MGDLRIYNSDFGVTIRGINYDFDHVESLVVDDPERTRLTRGANAKNKTGLVYKEGVMEAKTITVTVKGMPLDLFNLVQEVYESEERVDCYAIDRTNGSSKIGKNCVISQLPQQLNLDETPDSLNVAMIFETFDLKDKRKS
jgi:hypothetical protein